MLAAVISVFLIAQATPGPRYNTNYKAPAPTVVDEDVCHFAGKEFSISLPSPTGFPDEDDMVLTFDQGGKKVEARWPGKFTTAWWMLDPQGEAPIRWQIGSLCGRVDAVVVGPGMLLILLRQSGRPNADELVGVLYDVEHHAVLDMQILGAEGSLVERGEGVLWFETREYGEGVHGEMIRKPEDQLPLPDGDRLVSVRGDPKPMNPVLAVRVRSGRIETETDPARTIRVKGWTRIFPRPDSYKAVFPNDGYFRSGRTAAGRVCVQAATWENVSAWRTLPWHCERSPSAAQ